MSPELSLVVPVYNEEGVVGEVIRSWVVELDRLDVDFELLVYDDGSTDGTWEILTDLAARDSRVRSRSQANRGHGPTLLRGYNEARGEWVFQLDSDGEIPPDGFEALWHRREAYDFLLGYRASRSAPKARRLLSQIARFAVWVLFGGTLNDVNCPYRLMRRSWLQEALAWLPATTFAPNVALSGLALGWGARIGQQPLHHRGRTTGQVSLEGGKLGRAALRALGETAAIAWRFRFRDRRRHGHSVTGGAGATGEGSGGDAATWMAPKRRKR